MPTIRQRIADVLLGDEKHKLQEMAQQLYAAYQAGPYQLPPEELIRQLKETDASIVQDLAMQLAYDNIGSMAGYYQDIGGELRRAIDESRRLWKYAPLAQWSINVWTNYGLGESIKIVCDDPDADAVWQEAWTADRNAELFADDKIHEISNWTLVCGSEFIAAYASTLDGKTTFTEIDENEITEIVTDPDNSLKQLFYKRQFSQGTENKEWYYPDWQAFFEGEDTLSKAKLPEGAIRADMVNQSTTVCVLHIAHNRKERKTLRGYPILYIGAPYARSHKKFMEDRLSVSAAVAMFVDKIKVQGSSRAVTAVKNKLNSTLTGGNFSETNPPAIAGSTWLENQAADRTRFPLASGASDAKTDNEMFAWMSLIGWGLFPTTAGMDTSRWATALAMDKTQSMQWSRYQTFWSAQFKKMVKIVLNYAEKYDNQSFDKKTAQVSIDSFSIVDFPGVVESMSQLLSQLTAMVTASAIPAQAARRIAQEFYRTALKALGVTNDDATSDATFDIKPNELPPAVQQTIEAAIRNFKEGNASIDDTAQFVMAELIENANHNGHSRGS